MLGQGVCSYNGYTFPPDWIHTQGIDAKPIPTSDGRSVKWVEYTITVSTRVQSNTGTDGSLENIRRRLTAYGGELHYDGHGFGIASLSVNGAGGIRDVNWGLKPQILRWKPVGAAQAGEIVWTVTTCIPECTGASYQNALAEYCFKVGFSIDQSGFTRRTYSGHAILAQSKATVNAVAIQASVDAFREEVVPPVLPGFRRSSQQYDVDESKCRLDFVVVDDELPEPLPPFVVDCKASHEVHWDARAAHAVATLTAEYELVKGKPRQAAWPLFFAMASERIKVSQANATQFDKRTGASVVLWDLSLKEPDIFGRNKAGFSLTYMIVTDLPSILKASGLWVPVSGANDTTWRTSLAKVMGPRGNAGLQFLPQQDVIISLCPTGQVNTLRAGGIPLAFANAKLGTIPVGPPDPSTSWIAYDLRARIEVQPETVEMKPLPLTDVQLAAGMLPVPLGDVGQGAGQLNNNQDGWQPPVQPGTASTVQRRAQPSVYLTISGKALRAGYEISQPGVQTIGGILAEPIESPRNAFETGLVANALGVPVVGARWSQKYLLPQMPASLGVPGNPVYSS